MIPLGAAAEIDRALPRLQADPGKQRDALGPQLRGLTLQPGTLTRAAAKRMNRCGVLRARRRWGGNSAIRGWPALAFSVSKRGGYQCPAGMAQRWRSNSSMVSAISARASWRAYSACRRRACSR